MSTTANISPRRWEVLIRELDELLEEYP